MDHIFAISPSSTLLKGQKTNEGTRDVVYLVMELIMDPICGLVAKSSGPALTWNSHEERIIDELAGAIWRTIYLKRVEVPEDIVVSFAEYVRREQQSLQDIPSAAIMEGRIEWGRPPAWKKDKNTLSEGNYRALMDLVFDNCCYCRGQATNCKERANGRARLMARSLFSRRQKVLLERQDSRVALGIA